jgi:cytochrome c oxidase subunit 2
MTGQLFLNINPSSIFDAASPQAARIRHLTIEFIIAASAILILVVILTSFISIKYRSKRQQEDPKQITGNRTLEMWMVGVPLILVILFFFRSLATMNAVLPDRGNHSPDIIITGHQWFWEAVYPGTTITTANEIHLPVGKRILMQLNAADVIHDWWVPALGGKMDMIPGMNNYLWVTIDRPGIYEGACSERGRQDRTPFKGYRQDLGPAGPQSVVGGDHRKAVELFQTDRAARRDRPGLGASRWRALYDPH